MISLLVVGAKKFRDLAAGHRQEADRRQEADGRIENPFSPPKVDNLSGLDNLAASDEETADKYRVSAAFAQLSTEYHKFLRLKYERAARYPWLPVAPDPPEPK